MYNFYPKKLVQPPGCAPNILLIMKLTTLILVAAILQVSASTFAQKITLSENNTPLKKVFEKISDQTGYDFIISSENLNLSKSVNINLQNEELKPALNSIFANQPLSFIIQEKIVVVSKKEIVKKSSKNPIYLTINGQVTDTTGVSLPGATVKIKHSNTVIITNSEGKFTIEANDGDLIEVSFVGFQPYSFFVRQDLLYKKIILHALPSKLNEVQVIGYGTVSKRLNTGAVSSISATDIEKQPVTNILSTLSGRMPGVFVQTTNGLPGGNINIQIRGKGSIQAGTDPLYIIDGVPFASSVVPSNDAIAIGSLNGVISPFNSINPSDIESISVLKDADATAIYGSRGTNGVVLITTKKGKAGTTKFDVNISQGITKIANEPALLNLQQFLQIRREAFKNDGITPTTANAPELLLWDTTKYTNWPKSLFGGTGHSTNLQANISGGNENTNFNVSGNYHRESTVLPGDNLYQRGGLYMNLQHTSPNKKFSMLISGSYNSDNNNSTNFVTSVSTAIILPPDYPIYDAAGNYNWNITNPEAILQATSKFKTDNLAGNTVLKYVIQPGLDVKVSAGYNKNTINQTEIFPTVSLFPNSTNYSRFGTYSVQSVIIEPQVNYNKTFGKSTIALLAGATYQNRTAPGQTIQASNFTSQSLMENVGSAATVVNSNVYTQYKYESLFGRVTYNWQDTYILNATVRRDGSSRFGSDQQFGTFGSVGGAWLFTNENWIKQNLIFLSFGKLRVSYGVTGNDQIPDYQYLSTYGSNQSLNYQTFSALTPTRIANYNFHWETTKKLEFAVDLGFLHDRILLTVDRYQNKSDDQLVAYAIPSITGFTTYQANLPAVVENTGWEFELNTKNISTKNFKWSTSFNLTLPKNILKSFNDFSTSSYAQTLQIGYDITRIYGYQLLGVDPATGKASYATQPGSSSTSPYLFNTLGKQTPDFYGGIGNSFSYKRWQLDLFSQFAKQMAKGGLFTSPGLKYNNYLLTQNRWSRPGDITNVPKASTISDFYYTGSSANFFNTSYFRLKNAAISYSFSPEWLKKLTLNNLKVYAEGQNIFTLWDKNSAILDPESGALTSAVKNIPPMRTIIVGLQIGL